MSVSLSNRTLALLAQPFEGGDGPSHSTVDLIWAMADAMDYLPVEGNKLNRVLGGLKILQTGGVPDSGAPRLPADEPKLRRVAGNLAARLLAAGFVDPDEFEAALSKDGFALDDELTPVRPSDEPADRLAGHVVDSLFGDRPEFEVACNHFEQGNRAFDRGDWEAANAQFRSSCDAVYDALARAHGSPASKKGGKARQWLEAQDLLEKDEADLLRSFMAFAGRAGSHAGLSGAADAQLRRHMATALIAFGVAKFD